MTEKLARKCTWHARWAALVLVCGLCACTDEGNLQNERLQTARAALQAGDLDLAEQPLKALLSTNPDLAEARVLLGQALLRKGDAAGAAVEFRRAVSLGSADEQLLPSLARALVGSGQGAAVLREFINTRLDDAAADAALRVQVAHAQALAGQLSLAEANVAAALKRVPAQADAEFLRARLAGARGALNDALVGMQALLERQPKLDDAWLFKGDLLTAMGQRQAARAAHSQALALNAKNRGAHSSLFALYLADSDSVSAERHLAALRELAPNYHSTLFAEARLAWLRGQAKRTRELTQLLLVSSPNDLQLLKLAAEAETRLGSYSHAVKLMERVVKLDPQGSAPRLALASMHLRRGQPDPALRALAPLLKPKEPDVRALLLGALAQWRLGDTAAAERQFNRAARVRPLAPEARTALAFYRLATNQGAPALRELKTVLDNDRSAAVDLVLIELLFNRGDFSGALKAVDVLARKRPDEPQADVWRGRIALRQNDLQAARQSFTRAWSSADDLMAAADGLAAVDRLELRPQDAVARYKTMLERDPGHVGALLALADLAADGDKPSDSTSRNRVEAWLLKAIDADPEDPSPRLRLIDHRLRAGQAQGALEAAQEATASLPASAELLQRLAAAEAATGAAAQSARTRARLLQMPPPVAEEHQWHSLLSLLAP